MAKQMTRINTIYRKYFKKVFFVLYKINKINNKTYNIGSFMDFKRQSKNYSKTFKKFQTES